MRFSSKCLLAVATSYLAIGVASAVPVHTSNTDVTSWDVGTGQVNGNFSVTVDDVFAGGTELGIRAEQRRIGAVVPTSGDNYEAQAGVDPGTTNRAWWNFQLSIANDDIAANLDSLTLTIEQIAGTQVAPVVGATDLLGIRGVIDDRNVNGDANYADIYQVSQNPVFGWFPGYDLTDTSLTFAYQFTLTATAGNESISTAMCVSTAGLNCTAVSAPPTLLLFGLAGILLVMRRAVGAVPGR